jgi:hypothetical protein
MEGSVAVGSEEEVGMHKVQYIPYTVFELTWNIELEKVPGVEHMVTNK